METNRVMSGRPALVRTRDVKAVIMAAKKTGVSKIEVSLGKTSVILHLNDNEPSTSSPGLDAQITL